MNCERFDELVDLLAAGELEPEAATQAQSHAGHCPNCARQLEAARDRLRTLEAGLGALGASEGFVERVMGALHAEAERARRPAQASSRESWRSHVLRYAAYAAAASLFLMAGYGFLNRPTAARFRYGSATDEYAKRIRPGETLNAGERITTVKSGELSRVDMAEGRLQAVLPPGSSLRLADPRTGVLATLERGDLFWRVAGAQASVTFATPLAKVRAGSGDFSLHVAPAPGESGQGPFTGQVTIVTRNGSAWVQLPGHGQGPLVLGPGQVLTLRSDPRRAATEPLPFDAVEKSVLSQIRDLQARRDHLERLWNEVSAAVGAAPTPQQAELLRGRATGYEKAMQQADQAAAERNRLLECLRRAHDQGQHIFQVVLQQSPDRP